MKWCGTALSQGTTLVSDSIKILFSLFILIILKNAFKKATLLNSCSAWKLISPMELKY